MATRVRTTDGTTRMAPGSNASRAGGRHAWLWFLVVGLSSAVAFEALPDRSAAQTAIPPLLSAAAAAAFVVGVRTHRPAAPSAWRALTAGAVLYALSAAVWYPTFAGFLSLSYPSIADLGFLACFVALATGIGLLIQHRNAGQDRGSAVDAVIVGAGVAVVAWIELVQPYMNDPGLSPPARLASAAYPMADVLLLAMVVRLILLPGGRRNGAAILLGCYVSLQLFGNTTFGLTILSGGVFTVNSSSFALWIASLACLGAAALHPRMRDLAVPQDLGGQTPGRWRMVVLYLAAVAAVAAPVAELTSGSSLTPLDRAVFNGITLVLFLLILPRVRGLNVSAEEHRRVLTRLKAAENLYRNLVETNPAVTNVDVLEPDTDAGHRTEYMSPQIEGWVGLPAQAFMDDPALWGSIIHPDDRAGAEAAYQRHFRTGAPLALEYRLVGKDGRTIWIHDQVVQVDVGGRRLSQGVAYDITEKRRIDASDRAREVAEEANRAKDELLSRVSHELRTPLNAILGFGQLLEMSELSEDDRESAERIVTAGRHLLSLVDHILQISDRSVLEPLAAETVAVMEAAHAAEQLVATRARSLGVEVRIIGNGMHVLADREALGDVLYRLLDHAVLNERAGGLVTADWHRETDGLVRIEVAGTSSIRDEDLPSLFLPFSRVSSQLDSPHAGAGLDLALSKRAVEAMGGTITARTDEQGSRFEIRLAAS